MNPAVVAIATDLPSALDQPTVCAAFQQTAVEYAEHTALRTKGDAVSLTWAEYAARVRRVATGLHRLGVERGDTVCLMLTNRAEFHVVDAGAMHLGAVTCSIYNSSSVEQTRFVLDDADAKILVTEQAFADVALAAARQAGMTGVVLVDAEAAGALPLGELEADSEAEDFDFEGTWRRVGNEDSLSIIYTSGTTGAPKGVQLTHSAAMAAGRSFLPVVPLAPGSHVISYLPMAHVAERCCSHWLPMTLGLTVTTCPDPREVIAYLPDVRPEWLFSVPRVWEKLKVALQAAIDAAPAPRAEAMRRAVERESNSGHAHAGVGSRREELDGDDVFGELRRDLGLDRLRVAMVGAAPTPIDVLDFFAAVGIPLSEIWGMSELCAASCVNPPTRPKRGTVGPPLPGVEVRLATDHELLVKSPAVMAGYRNRPHDTHEVIDGDGWLHTGDLAAIDQDGYVTIIGRKKELIINAAGKNMSPANIEAAVKAGSPLIDQICCIGDRRPYNVALITLDAPALEFFAQRNNVSAASLDTLVGEVRVREEIAAAVRQANERLSRVEQIKRFAVLPVTWEPSGDELTPTMKLKRAVIAEKYAAYIETLYAA